MSFLGFSIVGNPKMTFIFILKELQPPGGGAGGPTGGVESFTTKYHVLSILGFSIVGNPKMTFIFILGYPNPCKGALRGGGTGGPTGGVESYTNKYLVFCQFWGFQ